ncbi:MAG: phosphotransferase [bacterium]|nr:phosphotransferase [bacterium]
MGGWRMLRELKRDALGRVELLEGPGGRVVRRVACGSRIPGSRWAARHLMERERRALQSLGGMDAVPHLPEGSQAAAVPSADGRPPRAADVLVRSYIAGEPLHRASTLPVDFFDRLDELVQLVHARGVCHNDLHKEQNVVVRADGRPALIDFQLASYHASGSRKFAARVHDDLRHVQKHRRRYTRDGRGPEAAGVAHGAGLGKRRTLIARAWRRGVKPVYVFVTRRLLRTRDGEERRPSSGPWPEWVEPVGPSARER